VQLKSQVEGKTGKGGKGEEGVADKLYTGRNHFCPGQLTTPIDIRQDIFRSFTTTTSCYSYYEARHEI
jgi:hypothetical protein